MGAARSVKLVATPLPGVFVAETTVIEDQRGAFARFFCAEELAAAFGGRPVVQINHSRTARVGSVRGLHFQYPPHAEYKLIRCLRGRVFDVAVDLRAGSATFLKWHAVELTPGNARLFLLPEGCAHGFQVLEPDSELLYLHSAAYAPGAEGGVRHDDPRVGIAWPLPVADLSARDASHPLLDADFRGLMA